MKTQIIGIIINFIISGLLGYCVKALKDYKNKLKAKEEEGKLLKKALMTMFQSNLTNTYLAYSTKKKIPDFAYRSWCNNFKIYKQLDGNEYCDTLNEKIENWEIVRTDILN